MPIKITFTANDESVKNSYGFHVATAGIDLNTRFLQNPIILNNHNNSTKDVLGKWLDVEKKDGKLYMSPAFDTEDPDGKEVVRKVNNGTIRGCSMGIMFDPEDMKNESGKIILKKCVLFEVSIVAIPANENAVALFNMQGEAISEQEVKSLCLKLQTTNPFENNNIEMKTILQHLQLAEGTTEEAVLAAIKETEKKLSEAKAENAELKAEISAFAAAEKKRNEAELKALLDSAVKSGKIDADGREKFEKLELKVAKDILAAIPARRSVKDAIDPEKNPLEKYEKLSWEELDKGNHLAALKSNFPDYYQERYDQQFKSSEK